MALPELPVEGQNPWYDDRTDWDLAVEIELDARRRVSTEPINALDYGSALNKATLIAAMDAAEAKGPGSVVIIPEGTWELGTGLSMSGRSCQLQGVGGAAGSTASPRGTVLKASTQSGPVIDWTDWVIPNNFLGRITHGNFHVVGSGVTDPTKNNVGMRFSSISSCTFKDISIRGTGGPCMEGISKPGNAVYLNDFERIIMATPVDAGVNDVPYMIFNEANGNRFRGCAIRSVLPSNDCGVSGAIVMKSNASYPANRTLFDGFWVEHIHPPTNGTIFANEANLITYADTQFFDVLKESGATNTSAWRLTPTPIADQGGNIIRGEIPGRQPLTLDYGVDVQQSGNLIEGVKGYNGYNVKLASGVQGTTVELSGAVSNASGTGWEDNSGNLTNTLLDHHLGVRQYGYRGTSPFMSLKANGQHMFSKLGANGNVSGNFSLAYGAADVHTAVLTGNATITSVSNPSPQARLTVIIYQDATGGRTLTWPASFKWTGTTPVVSTAANARSVFEFIYIGADWIELSRQLG